MIDEAQMLDRFGRVRNLRDGEWLVTCPAHADRTPSLHITLAEDRWLLCCQADCATHDVVQAAGLNWADLFTQNGNGHREIVATYDYVDEAGELLFQVVRFDPKDFRQRRPDGNGGWIWSLNGTRRVLFRLPSVLNAVERGEDIVVAEGEKDALALGKLGIVATTAAAGAGKWRPEYTEALRGAKVTIVVDRDQPGYAHARQVAEALDGIAAEVDVVEPTRGKDISDHLAAGGTIAELVAVPSAMVPPGLREVAPGTALEGDFDLAKFRVLDVARMVAETPPPVPWQVDGLTVQGDMTVMTGDPGAGKSLLALTLCGAIARGESIAGIDCAPGTVVYLDAENGGREIHRRLHSLGIPLAGVTVVEADGVNLRDDSDFNGLESLIKVYAPSMVVLDSLTALWPGANERRTEDVAPTLYAIKRLAERHGVAILVLHHRPKDGGEYRGTTAIAAAAQLGFTLSKIKDDPDRTRRRLHCWKCRPSAEPADRWLHLDAERGMVLVGVAEPYQDPDEPERQAPARVALAPRFLDALGDRRMGLAEIAGRLGVSPKDGTLRRVADHLLAGGEIVRGDDKKFSRCQVPSASGPRERGTVAPGTPLSRAEMGDSSLIELADAEMERLRLKGQT